MTALDDLYALVPAVACLGLCHAACGPVPLEPAEKARLHTLTGRRPRTLPIDTEAGRTAILRPTAEGECVHLRRGRCSVYAARPLICRLYGVADGLRCAHGCVPDRLLTRDEARGLIEAVARL